jgi:hypothetical protein
MYSLNLLQSYTVTRNAFGLLKPIVAFVKYEQANWALLQVPTESKPVIKLLTFVTVFKFEIHILYFIVGDIVQKIFKLYSIDSFHRQNNRKFKI